MSAITQISDQQPNVSFERVLIATDFSPVSERALAYSIRPPVKMSSKAFNSFQLMPSFLWLGAVVFVLTAYLGYAYWDRYKSIFSRN